MSDQDRPRPLWKILEELARYGVEIRPEHLAIRRPTEEEQLEYIRQETKRIYESAQRDLTISYDLISLPYDYPPSSKLLGTLTYMDRRSPPVECSMKILLEGHELIFLPGPDTLPRVYGVSVPVSDIHVRAAYSSPKMPIKVKRPDG